MSLEQKKTHFEKAARHTKRVRRLRWLLPIATLVIGAVFIGVSYLRSLLGRIDIGALQLEGNALVLQQPKIQGVDKKKRAYEITAKTARQSIARPKQVELSSIEANMKLDDKGSARITSDKGLFDGDTEIISLDGNIHITSSNGYDMRLEQMRIDTKAGTMVSDNPVVARQGANMLSADSLHVTDGGEIILFSGHVHAELQDAHLVSTP